VESTPGQVHWPLELQAKAPNLQALPAPQFALTKATSLQVAALPDAAQLQLQACHQQRQEASVHWVPAHLAPRWSSLACCPRLAMSRSAMALLELQQSTPV
jgi:hypothetical protein